jgi:Fe-S-cluster containining protein
VLSVPEVKPHEHEWCPHVRLPGGGCKIYPQRPDRCRDFHCQWLIDNRHPDYWYPAKSKIVIDAKVKQGVKYIAFIVDPGYPNRWREEPYFSDIKQVAAAGIEGRLGEKWTTLVFIKHEKIPIIGSERLLRVAG